MYPNTRGTDYIERAFRENDAGAIDAEAADMILQVACLGSIQYG